jgi:hypothetical protein
MPPRGASPAERLAMLNMLMNFLATQQWPRLIELLRSRMSYATYSNQSGQYDDLVGYFKGH